MKTPREILFDRHQGAEAKLDDLRKKVMARLAARNGAGIRTESSSFKLALRRWFWPSPWVWTGVGAAWILIFAFEFSSPYPPEEALAGSAKPLPASVVKMASTERLALMNSLLDLPPSEPAVPPRPPVTSRPHSESRRQWSCA